MHACMPNVQVRNVPEDVHEALVRRAEQAGQSLQQFLAAQLSLIASTPTTPVTRGCLERQRGRPQRHRRHYRAPLELPECWQRTTGATHPQQTGC